MDGSIFIYVQLQINYVRVLKYEPLELTISLVLI